MRWSERQLAMLRELGVRVWAPQGEPASALFVAGATEAITVAPPSVRAADGPNRPATAPRKRLPIGAVPMNAML